MERHASAAVANSFIGSIERAFEPARHFPQIGPARDHLAPGLRVLFRRPYAIYYSLVPDAVVIVQVIHGARDIDAIARQGGLE